MPVVLVVEDLKEVVDAVDVVDVVDVLGLEDEEASGSCSCVGSGSGSLQMPCSETGGPTGPGLEEGVLAEVFQALHPGRAPLRLQS